MKTIQVTITLKDTGKACYVTVCLSGSFVNILYKGLWDIRDIYDPIFDECQKILDQNWMYFIL